MKKCHQCTKTHENIFYRIALNTPCLPPDRVKLDFCSMECAVKYKKIRASEIKNSEQFFNKLKINTVSH